ncbi:hypothetical protein [Cellulomonas sp. C5510]|uniref:hypothetical protein n=1 Tax=Cellulomonas sp. C5510 TaxID=2871170 RepID=UPI001C93C5AA|nr:hypothetical protein [Cellulomonas sp. C5510]QZN84924.1 hypothetical protein K5O09_14090 [Cellulomonas sp. C5510]
MSEPPSRLTMDGGRITVHAADRSTLLGRHAPPFLLSVTPTPSPVFGANPVGVSLSIADARALRDMLDLLLAAHDESGSVREETFDWRKALVSEIRKADVRVLTGGYKMTGAPMPLVEEVEGQGSISLDNGINVIFDTVRDYVILATFPLVSGPQANSEAERAAVEARLGAAAERNGLVMSTVQVKATGARDRAYFRILSMSERDFFRSVDAIPPFTAEGMKRIRDFSQSVLRAARARFPELR